MRQVGSDLVRIKTSGRDTDGRYEVFEILSAPGSAVPLHRHAPAETVYVLDGRFRFPDGQGEELEAEPGDVVVIPSRAPHTFENVGGSTGRMLTVLAPAGMEQFFEAVGLPMPDDATEPTLLTDPPDVARLLAIAEAHGIEFLD